MKNILIISDNPSYDMYLENDTNTKVIRIRTKDIDFTSSIWIDNLRHILNTHKVIDCLDTIILDYADPFCSVSRNNQLATKIFQTLHTIYSKSELNFLVFCSYLDEDSILLKDFRHTVRTDTLVKSIITNCRYNSVTDFKFLLNYFMKSSAKSLVVIQES